MIDHRRIQRTLFRMQHDARFAERLRARDDDAIASTALDADSLALLLAAPVAAVEADPGGKRRAQFLRNVSSEHALTCARAGAEIVESFTTSPEFHAAMREDRSLPLAFADHAVRWSAATEDALLRALARVEQAMASLRRGPFARVGAPPGGLALGERAEILSLPGGTIAAAARLRQALDANAAVPGDLDIGVDAGEFALVLGGPRPSPHQLASVSIERLNALAGELLSLCAGPATAADLAAFRTRHEVTEPELAAFTAGLIADGALARHTDAP